MEHAGSLLKIIKAVQSMQIKRAEDFGEVVIQLQQNPTVAVNK